MEEKSSKQNNLIITGLLVIALVCICGLFVYRFLEADVRGMLIMIPNTIVSGLLGYLAKHVPWVSETKPTSAENQN